MYHRLFLIMLRVSCQKRQFQTIGKKIVYFCSKRVSSQPGKAYKKTVPKFVAFSEFVYNRHIGCIALGGGIPWFKIMKIQLAHTYQDIISLENLLAAWQEFIVGKRKKKDVQEFAFNLMDNIVSLHNDLATRTYRHGGYHSFFITDPKRRHIHKAGVRDRLLHHAVYRILYPFFDRTFIADSYSCRNNKGMHNAINQFRDYAFRVSRNHTRTCSVLKCDIQKFFASVDQGILTQLLTRHIPDKDILNLLANILDSFHTEGKPETGLPLGNLTSQLFTNIYMNEFDQWVKHKLKATHYIRYADDFVFLSENKDDLEKMISRIRNFLSDHLVLTLHPNKLILKTIASGIDFLGWVHFPNHRVVRRATRRRMFGRIKAHATDETVASYLGLLSHGNAFRLQEGVVSHGWLWKA